MTTATLLVVSYTLRVPVDDYINRARSVAEQIGQSPGLLWKIWGMRRCDGEGTSVYLFKDRESAEEFLNGPTIDALRNGPAYNVITRLSEVEVDLSAETGATQMLTLLQCPDLCAL